MNKNKQAKRIIKPVAGSIKEYLNDLDVNCSEPLIRTINSNLIIKYQYKDLTESQLEEFKKIKNGLKCGLIYTIHKEQINFIFDTYNVIKNEKNILDDLLNFLKSDKAIHKFNL